jgi:adenine phosphoribosyltransferase
MRCRVQFTPMATGGTAAAACALLEAAGAYVVGCSFLVEIADLNGAEKVANYPRDTMLFR